MHTLIDHQKYCNNLFSYSRFRSREVSIGSLVLGGNHPIRIQSMTTTDTMDTIGTVEQSIRMIEAGCELVRITAPSLKEAQNLENIKKELRKRGYHTPLIADIHYTPNAAELAARIVEKVRINPGNYADKKKFETFEYTDAEYNAELDRIRERFVPLVKICKQYGTAMRIGTNHGSLSDRIMSRYGDTPLGMVESALEFLRICEDESYFNIVLSMKASNPQVMVQAYRLLVHKMIESKRNYPLHLGVTEAGDGEDGRIKSAIGIGALLEDGLGDTIRVSLTEDPEFEIPVAKMILSRYDYFSQHLQNHQRSLEYSFSELKSLKEKPGDINLPDNFNPFQYNKRETKSINTIGGSNVPRVIANLHELNTINRESLVVVGYHYSSKLDKWNISDSACDYIYVGSHQLNFEIPGTLSVIVDSEHWDQHQIKSFPYHSHLRSFLFDYSTVSRKSKVLNFVNLTLNDLQDDELLRRIKNDSTLVLIIKDACWPVYYRRFAIFRLMENEINVPVFFKSYFGKEYEKNTTQYQIDTAIDIGSMLLDGLGDGIWMEVDKSYGDNDIIKNLKLSNRSCFTILQAVRARISKTEYISCPSCGRTLFDLQETTAKIRSRTSHLKGIKIGIMGCIVNGPGEMADADYGYVGVGVGKITLYKGREVVKRGIPAEKAVDALIGLIKENGDWVDAGV